MPIDAVVQFQAKDIVHPRPQDVLCELFEKQTLEGRVIAVTDDGQDSGTFVVVRIEGLNEPVIVPVHHVREHERSLLRVGGPLWN